MESSQTSRFNIKSIVPFNLTPTFGEEDKCIRESVIHIELVFISYDN